MANEILHRPLILVAHPDDETLACGGLLQRAVTPMVVFATDGTPGGYGLERTFGSLKAYTELRLQEGARALGHIPRCSFKWLTRADGSYVGDQHVFEDLRDTAICLRELTRSFSPDAIVSHAYEGGHIDHDACSFLAMHIAAAFSLKRFEFPLYWTDEKGKSIPQQFREVSLKGAPGRPEAPPADILELRLSDEEIVCKNKMRAEYKTQSSTVASFAPGVERFRPAITTSSSFRIALCRSYLFQERRPRFYHTYRHRLPAKALLKKFAEFEEWRRQREDWPYQPDEMEQRSLTANPSRRA